MTHVCGKALDNFHRKFYLVFKAQLSGAKFNVHCGYAKVLSCEKFYRGMYSFLHWKWFQLPGGSLAPAIILSGKFAAESHPNLNLVSEATFWLKHLNLFPIFDTVITVRISGPCHSAFTANPEEKKNSHHCS